jgi:hypothetical protein
MKYITNRPVHLGSIALPQNAIFEANADGIVYGSYRETRCNVEAAVRAGWVKEYDGSEVPAPVARKAASTPIPASVPTAPPVKNSDGSFNPSRFKIENVETSEIPMSFNSPTKPVVEAASKQEFSRQNLKVSEEFRDQGSPKEVRKTASETADGISMTAPKPFKPVIVASDEKVSSDITFKESPKKFNPKVMERDGVAVSEPEEDTFVWDLSLHWKTRVARAKEIKRTDPSLFSHILKVETDTVRQHLVA